ncbi:tetratricopeptide repeat protein [Marinobacterium lutimaris]|uniref:Type IV secretion system putative lipoprotein virB7 n=1 Tax=Marinobacterium lutimaris TaxID=568106 RepID=A0A1H6D504_9GAMM|nr:tetratricopeptide repeat protein [Marinobacterium lutimaris]SEG80331.1 Tetratricopeptide repeat-containing protein [Marinobacterium lutimaris]
MKKIVPALGLALLLAGCAGPNPYRAPVEDRSESRSSTLPPPPGSVQEVDPSPGVKVQPIDEMPVFRQQRIEVPEESNAGSGTSGQDASQQTRNAAVVALLDTAQQETQNGDLRAAQNRLERALRIAPRDPQIYYQLADVQRRLGQFLQAEQVALKGVNVASGQAQQQRRLWSLIALIRSDAGDSAGAREAQQKASRY